MSHLPTHRSENSFGDLKPAYTAVQASVEANRCLFCADAPCVQSCPTGIDIPGFIRKIATGNLKGSARTIFDANILGMSCARVCPVEVLCAGACVFHEMGVPPIEIGRLQRYATDHAFGRGWRFHQAGPGTGRSVGLVGAGPASLAAAYRLRRFGHDCTIYERREVVGGLNTTGIAPYKMRADRALEEAAWILAIGGIEVESGLAVPGAVSWDDLEARHDALFLGFGLGPDRLPELPGKDLEGIHGAVDTIETWKCGTVDFGRVGTAVVIGGGNTAIDAVRALRGLGIPDVIMAYRGTETGMSGYEHEWALAKKEGARALWQRGPVAYVGVGGRVSGVRFLHLDDHKNPRPGTEHVVPADLVLVAIGQARLDTLVAPLNGVRTEGGRVVVDADGFTGRPGVFAGGDCTNGGKEVVNAAAEGKRAAEAIHAWLSGESDDA